MKRFMRSAKLLSLHMLSKLPLFQLLVFLSAVVAGVVLAKFVGFSPALSELFLLDFVQLLSHYPRLCCVSDCV
jgi:hypothetical protein